MRIIMEKCKWICLGPNNTQTRYSLGRKLLKQFKDRKIGCKMVASASCRDHGVVGGQGGSRLGGGPPRRPTHRWLVASSEGSSSFSLPDRPILMFLRVGWGEVPYEMGVWKKQVTFQPPGICYGVSIPDWILFFFFFFQFYFCTCFNLLYFNNIDLIHQKNRVSPMAQQVKNLPAMQETWVQSLDWEYSPGEGNGSPLQYSCLENSMERRVWWATVHVVAKSQMWLSN